MPAGQIMETRFAESEARREIMERSARLREKS